MLACLFNVLLNSSFNATLIKMFTYKGLKISLICLKYNCIKALVELMEKDK